MRALPARYNYHDSIWLRVLVSTFASTSPLTRCSYWKPPSDMSIHNAYDVADESDPNNKAFTKLTLYVNSSVYGFRSINKTPTQKPIHIGQLKKWCLGLMGSNIFAKARICVSPYEHRTKYTNDISSNSHIPQTYRLDHPAAHCPLVYLGMVGSLRTLLNPLR